MKSLLFVTSILLATACHHHKDAEPTTPTTATGTAGDGTMAEDEGPMVDPTMPSWAPRSCRGYHAAVVSATSCMDVAQGKRDEIKSKYDSAHASWQSMQNVPPETIEQIRMLCLESMKSVRADMGGACPNNTTNVAPNS